MPHFPRQRVLIGFAVIGLAAGCHSKAPDAAPPPPEVGVVTLQSQPATLTTELPGRVSAVETSEVRPQVNGIVQQSLFEQGSLVHQGQLLYQIQDAPYRAALGTALGNLATAQAAIHASQLQAERYHRLLAIKGVSQQDVDNADAAAEQAKATVEARRADVQAARINLGFTQIRAPISGRIGRSLITVGALAQTGQASPLATIQRMDKVYVDVTEPAADLIDLREAIRAGSVTRAAPDAAQVELVLPNGQTYPIRGRLDFSEVTVDQSSGSVTIRATFANPDGTLLPGLYVRARLVEGVRQKAVLAPQQGVTRDEQGQSIALVIGAGNKVEQRTITTAQAIGDKWIITKGLQPGDRIIVEGQLNVKPGQVVTPKPPQQVAAGDDAASDQAGK